MKVVTNDCQIKTLKNNCYLHGLDPHGLIANDSQVIKYSETDECFQY